MKKILFLLIVTTSIISAQKIKKVPVQQLLAMNSQFNKLNADSISGNTFSTAVSLAKKSNGLGILYSLVLPGMGELYAGDYSSGKYFTIADAALWGLLVGLNVYGSDQEDNYKSFATAFAGADVSGKDNLFFANMGNYNSVEEYNKEKYLDRDFENVYDTKTHYWQWNSKQQRRDYRSTWSASENAYNNRKFVVWGLLLNRVVSAINAVRLVSKYNKKLQQDKVSWDISVGLKKLRVTLPTSMTINFNTSF